MNMKRLFPTLSPPGLLAFLTLGFLALMTAACNITVQTGTETQKATTVSVEDQVATSVAATLTAQTSAPSPAQASPEFTEEAVSPTAPAATSIPPTSTPTPPPPTNTPAPTATPVPGPPITVHPPPTVQPPATLIAPTLALPTATPTPFPIITPPPVLTGAPPAITPIITLPPPARVCDPPPATSFQSILNSHPNLAADLGCPTSLHPRITPEAWQVQTAYQPFQHGAMLWSNKIGWYDQPVIYVMFGNGVYQRFDDTFDPNTDPESGGETPPSGLYEPIRGFGKVWRANPSVRNALGWATAPETGGPGYFQIMEGGEIIWSGTTNHTYVFDRAGGNAWYDFAVSFQP